eukprot:1036016-Prymnesium_polylepis.1
MARPGVSEAAAPSEFVAFVGLQYPPWMGRKSCLQAHIEQNTSFCNPEHKRGVRAPRCQRCCSAHQHVAVLNWIRQTQRLASAVTGATGERTSVHMYTTCLRASAGALLTRLGEKGSAVPIVIRDTFDPELLGALGAIREAPSKWPASLAAATMARKREVLKDNPHLS